MGSESEISHCSQPEYCWSFFCSGPWGENPHLVAIAVVRTFPDQVSAIYPKTRSKRQIGPWTSATDIQANADWKVHFSLSVKKITVIEVNIAMFMNVKLIRLRLHYITTYACSEPLCCFGQNSNLGGAGHSGKRATYQREQQHQFKYLHEESAKISHCAQNTMRVDVHFCNFLVLRQLE